MTGSGSEWRKELVLLSHRLSFRHVRRLRPMQRVVRSSHYCAVTCGIPGAVPSDSDQANSARGKHEFIFTGSSRVRARAGHPTTPDGSRMSPTPVC